MSSPSLTVLSLDDNPDDRALVRRELERAFDGIAIDEIIEQSGLDKALARGEFQAVITDFQLRWTDGLKVLYAVKARYPDCPVIMFTNTGTEEVAVEALKSGLDDYILKKPQRYARVPISLRLALERAAERRRAREAEQEIRDLNRRLQRAMRETHHRIKNSLQIISALIDMQVMQHPDGSVPIRELERIGNQVRALATVHDILTLQVQTEPSAEQISLRAALDRLLPILQENPQERRILVTADDVGMPINRGTSVLLLVNELLSNAIKHGRGDITLTLRREEDTVEIAVEDNGSGFPEGFSPEGNGSTGVDLIESLAHWDLRGTTLYANRAQGGARVIVTFPLVMPAGEEAAETSQ